MSAARAAQLAKLGIKDEALERELESAKQRRKSVRQIATFEKKDIDGRVKGMMRSTFDALLG